MLMQRYPTFPHQMRPPEGSAANCSVLWTAPAVYVCRAMIKMEKGMRCTLWLDGII